MEIILLFFIICILIAWSDSYSVDTEHKENSGTNNVDVDKLFKELEELLSDDKPIKPTNVKPKKKTTSEESYFLNTVPTTWTIADKQYYLKTEEWNNKRKQRLKIDNYTCKRCGKRGVPLEVHHISYSSLGNENMKDIVSLCRQCHEIIHNRHGYDYDGYYPII